MPEVERYWIKGLENMLKPVEEKWFGILISYIVDIEDKAYKDGENHSDLLDSRGR